VLEDSKLINMLKESKTKSQEIKESKEEAERSNQTLVEERKKYINVAIRGSILYFILTDLSLIDPMYQFSLERINKLFCSVIEKEKETLKKVWRESTNYFAASLKRKKKHSRKWLTPLNTC